MVIPEGHAPRHEIVEQSDVAKTGTVVLAFVFSIEVCI
jgi:hypothetical protein